MRILHRHIVKEFLRIFILCEISFTFIYLMIDFIGKIDNFLEVGAGFKPCVAYFLYKLPFLALQMTPAATLIAVVVLFSALRKQNEITALKASGVSVSRCSLPLLFVSVVLTLGVLLTSELLVPFTSGKSEHIWNTVVRREDEKKALTRNHVWQRGGDNIFHIQFFDGRRKLMDQLTVYIFDPNFQVAQEIHAKKALWSKDAWVAVDGIQLERRGDGSYAMSQFMTLTLPVKQQPEDFLVPMKEPEEMTYLQLKRFAQQIEADGYDANEYFVELYLKVAFPFINCIMVLWGIPIALGIPRGGAPAGVAAGIGVCFAYIVVLGVMRSLGLNGVLPPWLAIWSANIGFGFLGCYALLKVRT